MTKITINVSTECYDEIYAAMKAAGLEAMPNELTIKRDMTIQQPIDMRLATIRRDCLVEAVKCACPTADKVNLAQQMFDFVIGSLELVKVKQTGGWDK